MQSKVDFKNLEQNQNLAFKLEEQKKENNINNSISEANEQKNLNYSVEGNIIKLKNIDEADDEDQVDALKEKNKESLEELKKDQLLDENSEEELMDKVSLEDKMAKQPKFKSKLSAGAEDFHFSYMERDDSSRMESVKKALRDYYKLRDTEAGDDKEMTEADKRVAVTASLQHIVSTCNKYIANRWPLSKEGRKRLREVKDLRKNAISELGEHAGHPGWRLAGEYVKFGLKAVTSPVWAPVKAVGKSVYYTGKWAGRVAKRIGRGIKRKAIRFADKTADSFHSWKAFFATIGAVLATALWGTIANVINTAIMGVCLPFWLLGSIVTFPRYLYHLAKGHVLLDATQYTGETKDSDVKKYRAMAFSIPTPHLYSTWFKYLSTIGPLGRAIHNRSEVKKSIKKEKGGSSIEYIHRSADEDGAAANYGEHQQYSTTFYGLLGPTRDVYYHSTTKMFKNIFNLLRYDNKNDDDKVADRADQEYMSAIDRTFDEEDLAGSEA